MSNEKNGRPNTIFGLLSEILSTLPQALRVILGIAIIGAFLFVVIYKFVWVDASTSQKEVSPKSYTVKGRLIDPKTQKDLLEVKKVCLEGYALKCDEIISEGVFIISNINLLPENQILSLRVHFTNDEIIGKDIEINPVSFNSSGNADLGTIPISNPLSEASSVPERQKRVDEGTGLHSPYKKPSLLKCKENGVVLNTENKPILDATVTLNIGNFSFKASTNAEGEYSFDIPSDLVTEDQFRIEAGKDGYTGAITKIICDGNFQPITIK